MQIIYPVKVGVRFPWATPEDIRGRLIEIVGKACVYTFDKNVDITQMSRRPIEDARNVELFCLMAQANLRSEVALTLRTAAVRAVGNMNAFGSYAVIGNEYYLYFKPDLIPQAA